MDIPNSAVDKQSDNESSKDVTNENDESTGLEKNITNEKRLEIPSSQNTSSPTNQNDGSLGLNKNITNEEGLEIPSSQNIPSQTNVNDESLILDENVTSEERLELLSSQNTLSQSTNGNSTENVPVSGVEEEDAVLGGDESTKFFDGNIDEDELLKDTDVDESRKNDGSNVENTKSSNSETPQNTEQLDNAVESGLDSNQNISNVQPSGLEIKENANIENPADEGNSNIETETSNNDIPRDEGDEETAASNSIKPSDCGVTISNNKNDSVDSANHDIEMSTSTDCLIESLNESDNINDDCTGSSSNNEAIENNTKCENIKDSVEVGKEKNDNTIGDNDDVTKFLHVDQDNSRPDESFDSMETGGEDPFAQTLDDVMVENSEKETEFDKTGQSHTKSGEMDVDQTPSNITNETTEKIENQSLTANDTVAENTKEVEQNDTSIGSSDTLTISNSQVSQNEETSSEKSIENKNTSSKKKHCLQPGKTQDADICIVPDKVTKEVQIFNQERSVSEVAIINSSKPKISKTSNKTRSKSKKSSSEDSSDNSDYETGTKLGTRPKRNAAKKAESQIKVLSAVEQEVEQEDGDSNDVQEIPDDEVNSEDTQTCFRCKKVGQCKINVLIYGKTNHFCDEKCFVSFQEGPIMRPGDIAEIVPPSSAIKDIRSADIQTIDRGEFIRKCSQCFSVVKNDDEKTLSWETMDFCTEECLGKYQQELGSHCANCKGNVQPASLGKYCVRFGYEVKQFCCSSCLEEFKKGLKVCSFCQKDMSNGSEGFLAPVGDKGTFKDFCTQACMEKYEQMSSNHPPPPKMLSCDVCNNNKLIEVEVFFDSKINKLCSDICFTAYKFANKLTVDRCDMCRKYFDKDANGEKFNIFYEGVPHNFCCKTCMNVYILAKRKIVPCNWCKVKKYNFDMIKRVQNNGQVLMMCSLNCLTLYQVSVNAVSSRRIKCDMCMSVAQAQYHLTMSDATIRNFCTYPCVMNFQQQYSKSPITLPGGDNPPIPTGAPKRVIQKNDSPAGVPVPVISSISSLVNGQPTVNNAATTLASKATSGKLNLTMRLTEPSINRNKSTQTRPVMNSKSVSCRPNATSVNVQTDGENKGKSVLIPVPVPIFVPCPMPMYSFPFPVPVPFPIPIPVPMFLPTTRNSIKGIMKEIKRIQEKVPTDPFEAELLMMAEMVAGDKKEVVTSSDSEPENEPASSDTRPNSDEEGDLGQEATETNNTFGDDIMQMALKIATELDQPAEDLEAHLTPTTILNKSQSESNSGDTETKKGKTGEGRGRKRSLKSHKSKGNAEIKRKKSNHSSDNTSQASPEPEEPKPDAHMKLKFTFGVNAWKNWVSEKNEEIEKLSSTNKKIKPFKTDILQMTSDELNFALCLFVKEVQKPNGTNYAPDTIYYLCLGIQLYLFENGRIDNIFTDSYYETFTDALDEVAQKFKDIFNDHHYVVTRVEEEHLWESKQLGAHSPHVLLSTLMFFNTKHFNLTNVEEHMMLSFSHIMKHWKRNPNQQSSGGSAKAPGSRNVLLRFYPPQSVLDDPYSKKKKVYEQHENEDNPLRCPVKLYEFYLSKCPESVKTRNDVFYLQPERSCVPDSPVWYSTMALNKEPLEKMLNRVKMVKEINIAILMP